MKTRRARLTVAVVALLITAGIAVSAAPRRHDVTQETGPVYNLEGAWYGMVTLTSGAQVPTLDNFTANAQKPGVEGSVLCTIPTTTWLHPDHPEDPTRSTFWLTMIGTGHGNWVRVDTNRVAYTAVRILVDQNGRYFGRARNWGTFTATSENGFEGSMTIELYRADGTPFRTLIGVAKSSRVEIVSEE